MYSNNSIRKRGQPSFRNENAPPKPFSNNKYTTKRSDSRPSIDLKNVKYEKCCDKEDKSGRFSHLKTL